MLGGPGTPAVKLTSDNTRDANFIWPIARGGVQRQAIRPDAAGVSFVAELPAGPVDLQAWFVDATGRRISGAYSVSVEPAP